MVMQLNVDGHGIYLEEIVCVNQSALRVRGELKQTTLTGPTVLLVRVSSSEWLPVRFSWRHRLIV
jgi:hypothetical protein